jgi:hypothetical protein
VADVEENPPLARLDHRVAHAAVGGRGIVREKAEAMGQNVTRPEPRQNVFERPGRMIDMDHHRQTKLFRGLPGYVERDNARILGSVKAHSNLDTDDRIAIGVCDLDRFGRRHQPQVATFADHNATGEPINAGEG